MFSMMTIVNNTALYTWTDLECSHHKEENVIMWGGVYVN